MNLVKKMFAKLKKLLLGTVNREHPIIFFADQETDYLQPIPAASAIPDWWKNMESYGGFKTYENGVKKINITNGGDNATIKRCIPVLDSMSIGYLIVTPADIYVEPKHVHNTNSENGPTKDFTMIYPRHYEKIHAHPWGQANLHPYATDQRLAKIFVPWRIRVPDGYSIIVTEPLNNSNPQWSVVSGVMDSDWFYPQMNFMVSIKDKDFNGIIPMGTPIAQIIPFKRETWSSIVVDGDKNSKTIIKDNRAVLDSRLSKVFSGAYKKFFWSRKEFR
jgi:hypothetical protein